MLSTFGYTIHQRCSLVGLIYCVTLLGYTAAVKYELDSCDMTDKSAGICRTLQDCQLLKDSLKRGDLSINNIVHCGFKGNDEIICCPKNEAKRVESRVGLPEARSRPRARTSSTTTTTANAMRSSIKGSTRAERPAVAACRTIEDSLTPVLTPHILDGTPVNPGEYPFMAAIGYSDIGNEGGPYNFRCGGALIHDRFVLTAAHCVVNSRNVTPEIVRLGMSNFDDPAELPNRVEVPIKQIHVHPNFSTTSKVNDVALLEFAKPVPKSKYIFPTCLYTEEADPPSSSNIYVAGWGVFNLTTNHSSNALLKTRMEIVPDHTCISAYSEHGYKVKAEHLCAADPKFTGDACWGDSGGPLILVVDEVIQSYRQVGIISSGYGCAGPVPGLYMKVSAFLDYIERIVWPDG